MNNDITPHTRRSGDAAGPAAGGLTRRQWLQGALALTAASLAGSLTLRALADTPSKAPLDAFMTLSEALTGKTGLDRTVGERLLAALQKGSLSFGDQLPKLAGALASNALTAEQEAVALKILEAWYTGLVDNTVITYEDALMFSVVSDTLVVRSYCPNKPGFWADKPIERQA
ncbi:hypothetical protein WS67_06485 [Burkholderia singularis]|uniref:Twin-arginine translocation pathway signal n=1 Tax=Burkholderia singularis TaxID=1503053 RepID=A0A103E587_9BURK|nr:sugar dehydrogenase complex small subunit [Burkholderia singularis]KVE28405.1 hypothetical protein WS67_06485 [Burkholderia singularis]